MSAIVKAKNMKRRPRLPSNNANKTKRVSLGLCPTDDKLQAPKPPGPLQNLVREQMAKLSEIENTVKESKKCSFQMQAALGTHMAKARSLEQKSEFDKIKNDQLLKLLTNNSYAVMSNEEETSATFSFIKSRILDTVEPLLMKQRFEELEEAYRQCKLQLEKKNKMIDMILNEKDEIKIKYERLIDEYCKEQTRFEIVCSKYMALQSRKKKQGFFLKNALSQACACIINAKMALCYGKDRDAHYRRKFEAKVDRLIELLVKYDKSVNESTGNTPTTNDVEMVGLTRVSDV